MPCRGAIGAILLQPARGHITMPPQKKTLRQQKRCLIRRCAKCRAGLVDKRSILCCGCVPLYPYLCFSCQQPCSNITVCSHVRCCKVCDECWDEEAHLCRSCKTKKYKPDYSEKPPVQKFDFAVQPPVLSYETRVLPIPAATPSKHRPPSPMCPPIPEPPRLVDRAVQCTISMLGSMRHPNGPDTMLPIDDAVDYITEPLGWRWGTSEDDIEFC